METFKNVLANKWMSDTNYIIIKDTDDLEELETQYQLFLTRMTVRQQRLSDDRSIELWGMTNKQHYEDMKSKLTAKQEKIHGGKDNQDTYSNEYGDDDIKDEDITKLLSSGLEDDPVSESTEIPIAISKTDINPNPISTLDYVINTYKNTQADQYQIDTNINIIGHIKGENREENLKDLEKQFINFNSQSHDHRKKSDDKCRELYGMSNLDRYNQLKAKYLKHTDIETKQVLTISDDNIKVKKDEVTLEFVSQVNENRIAEESRNLSDAMKHKRLNDTPYFTPTELIDMGVHGNHNWYSHEPDNDGLITHISSSTWFDSYKDMYERHVFEDYRKDWIRTLEHLYSDYEQIKESGDEDKINARKQSILDLGWNPEIPFTRENRRKAAKRVSDIMNSTVPNDIFIDMVTDLPDDEDTISESVSSTTHKPVFLIFEQGKTPIVSSGIQFFTKSAYSHAAISFDSSMNFIHSYNMNYNGRSGLVVENIKAYKDCVLSIMAFFAPNKIGESMKERVADFNNHKTDYDFSIIMNKVFNIDKKFTGDYKQVCSTFVDTVLQAGKVDLSKDINIPDPGQLYNSAKQHPNKIIEVYYGPANKYNSKAVDNKLNRLMAKNFLGIDEATMITEATLPTGYSLRPANQSDTKNMFDWKMDSIDTHIRDDKKVISYIKKDVQESIKDTKIIMYKDEPVGMLTACTIDTDWWYIGEIYLTKEHRGKGIGTKLLKDEIAKHNKIKLQVAYSNTKAKKLYESLGFEVESKNDAGHMYVMKLDKTVTNEAVSDLPSAESNDIYHNIDLWENGTSNLMWITGLSGSGKTTLTREICDKYKAEYIELDDLQRAKMGNWSYTNSEVMDSYIKSVGGLDKVFPYCNTLEKVQWKDIVCEENHCEKEFMKFFNYIIKYANQHKDKKFICEGVQIAYYTSDAMIKIMSDYPVILKMNGPLKTEFRRDKRLINHGIKEGDSFFNIFKKVTHRIYHWVKQDFYKKDWDELNYYRQGIGESTSIFNEVKQFPVEFDKEGNLIIYKAHIGSLSFGDEIQDSVQLLESYRNTNNLEGMKYELAKLWFINEQIEKQLKKRLPNDKYKVLIDTRATCLNAFKFNLEYLLKAEKGFNFSDYYNSTPFSDNSVKISASTISYTTSLIKSMI